MTYSQNRTYFVISTNIIVLLSAMMMFILMEFIIFEFPIQNLL